MALNISQTHDKTSNLIIAFFAFSLFSAMVTALMLDVFAPTYFYV